MQGIPLHRRRFHDEKSHCHESHYCVFFGVCQTRYSVTKEKLNQWCWCWYTAFTSKYCTDVILGRANGSSKVFKKTKVYWTLDPRRFITESTSRSQEQMVFEMNPNSILNWVFNDGLIVHFTSFVSLKCTSLVLETKKKADMLRPFLASSRRCN